MPHKVPRFHTDVFSFERNITQAHCSMGRWQGDERDSDSMRVCSEAAAGYLQCAICQELDGSPFIFCQKLMNFGWDPAALAQKWLCSGAHWKNNTAMSAPQWYNISTSLQPWSLHCKDCSAASISQHQVVGEWPVGILRNVIESVITAL